MTDELENLKAFRPDDTRDCDVCGASPVVSATGLCGPCTWGESDTAGGAWWDKDDEARYQALTGEAKPMSPTTPPNPGGTMTQKEALVELIAKVEAGEPSPHFIWQRSLELHYSLGYRAAGGSLDAAKALHEAVLPGWEADIELIGYANVHKTLRVDGFEAGITKRPARAWLLAILRALHSMEAP